MSVQMEFPNTFDEFVKEYGFKDDKEVYTNGSDLIQIFRVKQWLEHDNKLRAIETDTAYECGKAVLEQIRAEIEQLRIYKAQFLTNDNKVCIDSREVLDIIDKYR